MYMDGYEREDVIQYQNEFLKQWKKYEKQMVTYNNNGEIDTTPASFLVPQGIHFHLIFVTYNESTFYAYNQWKNQYTHATDKATP
jgi:hypothetical protein